MSTEKDPSNSLLCGLVDGSRATHEQTPISSDFGTAAYTALGDTEIAKGLIRSLPRVSTTWSQRDEELLLELFLSRFSNDWTRYQGYFPTRSVDSIKSKFHNLVRATQRKRSKIHSESHQRIAVMIKKAQDMIRDESKRSKHLIKPGLYSQGTTPSIGDEWTPKDFYEQYHDPLPLVLPPGPQLPAVSIMGNVMNNSLSVEIGSNGPNSRYCSLPTPQHLAPCSMPTLCPSSSNIGHLHMLQGSTETSEKVAPSAPAREPCLLLENGRLVSMPINYFGSIALPFVFQALNKPTTPPLLATKSLRGDARTTDSSPALCVKLTEGSYLNATCTHCGGTQTLIVKRVDGILIFDMLQSSAKPDQPRGSAFPVGSQRVVCRCPVCNTAVQLTRDENDYSWAIFYSASPRSPPLHISGFSSFSSQVSGVAELSTPLTQMNLSLDPPTPQFEIDSPGCHNWEMDFDCPTIPSYLPIGHQSKSASGSFELFAQAPQALTTGASDVFSRLFSTEKDDQSTSPRLLSANCAPEVTSICDYSTVDANIPLKQGCSPKYLLSSNPQSYKYSFVHTDGELIMNNTHECMSFISTCDS